jgi:hypothetical protein
MIDLSTPSKYLPSKPHALPHRPLRLRNGRLRENARACGLRQLPTTSSQPHSNALKHPSTVLDFRPAIADTMNMQTTPTRIHPRVAAASLFVGRHPLPAIEAEGVRVAPSLLPLAQTGYYGRIDDEGRIRTTKVHVHLAGEAKPACGSRLHSQMAFHFCASGARTYVDCERCERVVDILTAA